MTKVTIGTDEQMAMLRRLQDLINEEPDAIEQHIVIELLVASHLLRIPREGRDVAVDGMCRHIKQMIDQQVAKGYA